MRCCMIDIGYLWNSIVFLFNQDFTCVIISVIEQSGSTCLGTEGNEAVFLRALGYNNM